MMFFYLILKDFVSRLSYVIGWLVVSKFYPSASYLKQTVSTIES